MPKPRNLWNLEAQRKTIGNPSMKSGFNEALHRPLYTYIPHNSKLRIVSVVSFGQNIHKIYMKVWPYFMPCVVTVKVVESLHYCSFKAIF